MFFVRLCWFLFFFVLISTGLSHLFFPFGLEILHKWKWSNIICYLKYVLHFLTNFIWIEITPLKLLPFVRLFVSFQIPNHILRTFRVSYCSIQFVPQCKRHLAIYRNNLFNHSGWMLFQFKIFFIWYQNGFEVRNHFSNWIGHVDMEMNIQQDGKTWVPRTHVF